MLIRNNFIHNYIKNRIINTYLEFCLLKNTVAKGNRKITNGKINQRRNRDIT